MTNEHSSKTYWFSSLVVIAGIAGFIWFITMQGKGNQSEQVTVCSCVKASEKMSKEIREADGDDAKIQKIKKESEPIIRECTKLSERKSEEELQKLFEEARNCD